MPTLDWLTRGEDIKAAASVPYRLLEADPALSAGDQASGNMLIQGDNLEHSQWLAMIWPRLELLRELLAEDGSIWVSIDDNEGHYLKAIMDEVFGRRNFVTTFIWKKVDSPNDNKVAITPDHEFLLCYERSSGSGGFRQQDSQSILDAYGSIDEQGRLYRDRLLGSGPIDLSRPL